MGVIENFERKVLHRPDDQLTAIQGNAGSKKVGEKGSACYHNDANYSDYGLMGHAEVVEVLVPLDNVAEAFSVYFGSFVENPFIGAGQWSRPDFYDQGSEYRSLVGWPGGMNNARILREMKAADTRNITIRSGQGADPDSFGSGSVYIMDSD